MPFVQAKCTNCGANLSVDDSKDAAICPYCQTAYIVEKAINHFNVTNHIHGEVVNVIGGANEDFIVRAGILEKYNGSEIDVAIPDSVIEISRTAFLGCSHLRSIVVPESVRIVDKDTFKYCPGLKKISFAEGTSRIRFNINAWCPNVERVVIPKSMTCIGANSFSGLISLTSISMPDTLSAIYSNAFAGCEKLESIELPKALTFIGTQAFNGFLALQLVLDLLLCGGQIPGDLGNAVVIHQAPDPAARFR